MKVKIQDKEITLHYTMRMMIIFENITGANVDYTNFTSVKQISTFLCSCIIASAKIEKQEIDLTFDSFMDWLDEQGGYIILNEFTKWLLDEMEKEKFLMKKENIENDTEEAIKENKKGKKSKG